MAKPYHHAVSSQRQWGGEINDYLPIHEWFDETKELVGDFRHRALRHHTTGVQQAREIFGVSIRNSAGRDVPVRAIAEQHLMEDFGRLPTLADWLRCIKPAPWMVRARQLSRELEEAPQLLPEAEQPV